VRGYSRYRQMRAALNRLRNALDHGGRSPTSA